MYRVDTLFSTLRGGESVSRQVLGGKYAVLAAGNSRRTRYCVGALSFRSPAAVRNPAITRDTMSSPPLRLSHHRKTGN